MERWVPESLTNGYWTRRRRGLVAAGAAACLVVAVVVIVLVTAGAPGPEHAPVLPAAKEAARSPGADRPSERPGGPIVVSVVGKVSAPGLVTLPAGARAADAVRAAGGALPGTDLTGVNLARRLADGEQIVVGGPAAPAVAGSPAGAPGGKVNLNSATVEELDGLSGVGAVTAKRIIDWRTQHGGFTAVEQLREVDGIGETKFSRLRDQVTVS
ncbi:ComE operon protein 1 [Amycolatopsis sp. CA-230715]|nr:ComE operon protein 1 [Amycolatopsis sp. CA-230715]